jgi:hypothetical protein
LAAWPSRQKHSGSLAVSAKVELRQNVLSALPECRVFDAFCGPTGDMYRAAWSQAAHYVGVDTEWACADVRRRYVADTCLVLRAVDLSGYSVFDMDAFGSPWEAAIILSARRRWRAGERGALVLTDGSAGKEKYGHAVKALSQLVGPANHKSVIADRQSAGIYAWCKLAGVTPERVWQARGYSNTRGSQTMFYAAVVFHGATQAAADEA